MTKQKDHKNLGLISLYSTTTNSFILTADPFLQLRSSLSFDKQSQIFKCLSPKDTELKTMRFKKAYSAFLGVINIQNLNFLLFC